MVSPKPRPPPSQTADQKLTANWPEPWKYIQFPDPGLTITQGSDGETLTLSCKRPIKGIILDVEDRSTDEKEGECKWSDQAIDMMPGDDQVVVARGLKGRKVKARVSEGYVFYVFDVVADLFCVASVSWRWHCLSLRYCQDDIVLNCL